MLCLSPSLSYIDAMACRKISIPQIVSVTSTLQKIQSKTNSHYIQKLFSTPVRDILNHFPPP